MLGYDYFCHLNAMAVFIYNDSIAMVLLNL